MPSSEECRSIVTARHLTPQPRLREEATPGTIEAGVHAMVDVSDGLAGDIGHICRASGVGALIRAEEIPVSAACRETAAALGRDAFELGLAGGEDYELLFTVGPESAAEIIGNDQRGNRD